MDATERAILVHFSGEENAGLRRMICDALPSRRDVLAIQSRVVLTMRGWIGLQAVAATLPEEPIVSTVRKPPEVAMPTKANDRAFELRSELFALVDKFKRFSQAIHATFEPGADDATFDARCEAESQADRIACELAGLHLDLPDLFIDATRDPKDQAFAFDIEG